MDDHVRMSLEYNPSIFASAIFALSISVFVYTINIPILFVMLTKKKFQKQAGFSFRFRDNGTMKLLFLQYSKTHILLPNLPYFPLLR